MLGAVSFSECRVGILVLGAVLPVTGTPGSFFRDAFALHTVMHECLQHHIYFEAQVSLSGSFAKWSTWQRGALLSKISSGL